ncbi:MAG: hypothetical protein NTU83_07875, partial [Candidatus Hydrogenedentes bacterium]|nr:hypothetical protein [Candidatus Hydrogenedentota bacterium]
MPVAGQFLVVIAAAYDVEQRQVRRANGREQLRKHRTRDLLRTRDVRHDPVPSRELFARARVPRVHHHDGRMPPCEGHRRPLPAAESLFGYVAFIIRVEMLVVIGPRLESLIHRLVLLLLLVLVIVLVIVIERLGCSLDYEHEH